MKKMVHALGDNFKTVLSFRAAHQHFALIVVSECKWKSSEGYGQTIHKNNLILFISDCSDDLS